MQRKQMTPEEKEDARTANIKGYRGSGSNIYCLTCLCLNESIWHDESKPITKQIAYKENLVCDICGQPICTPKYSKFLKRVADAKSKNGKSL